LAGLTFLQQQQQRILQQSAAATSSSSSAASQGLSASALIPAPPIDLSLLLPFASSKETVPAKRKYTKKHGKSKYKGKKSKQTSKKQKDSTTREVIDFEEVERASQRTKTPLMEMRTPVEGVISTQKQPLHSPPLKESKPVSYPSSASMPALPPPFPESSPTDLAKSEIQLALKQDDLSASPFSPLTSATPATPLTSTLPVKTSIEPSSSTTQEKKKSEDSDEDNDLDFGMEDDEDDLMFSPSDEDPLGDLSLNPRKSKKEKLGKKSRKGRRLLWTL